MASITQDLRFKQAVIEYSFKHGCMFIKHLLHIGEKRREELIGGLPAQGRIGKLLYSFMYLLKVNVCQ